MSTLALNSALTKSRPREWSLAIRRAQPLLAVMRWELRRFRASRLLWLQALGFFCLVLFVTWAQRIPEQFVLANPAVPFHGSVAGTSAWGLLENLPPGPLMLLGLLLPFVTADGVTRDLSRRTHELLMTTAVPSRAYVWGRYLVGLLMSLGLALLLLIAILGMGLLLHLTTVGYPAPEIGTVMILWVGMVVPATVVLSSVSFALGTVFPRRATLVKILVMVGWFVSAVIIPPGGSADSTVLPAWYVNWDPTSAATAHGMLAQYRPDFRALAAAATSTAQLRHILLAVENTLPDIGGWFAPHLLLAGLSLVLVALAALGFQRFRKTFGT